MAWLRSTRISCVFAGFTCSLISCGGGATTDIKIADVQQQVAKLEAADPASTVVRLNKVRAASDEQSQQIAQLSAKVAVLERAVTELKSQKDKAASISQGVAPALGLPLQNVIRQCVGAVRALAPPGATPVGDVHVSFDAYYDPAMGRVVNNNHYVSQDAVYAFNKCMTDKGWPLH